MTYLVQVTKPGKRGFCAGAVVVDGRWVRVAPILRAWTSLTPRKAVIVWRKNGWTVTFTAC